MTSISSNSSKSSTTICGSWIRSGGSPALILFFFVLRGLTILDKLAPAGAGAALSVLR